MAINEYERLSAEILQNQRFRVTLFTFSVTTTAAIIGLTVGSIDLPSSLLSIFAIYSVLIPSIMMINHYTRSVNYISEYLNVFHSEKWMKYFDKLNEDVIPIDGNLSKSYKAMHLLGAFSTDKMFSYAYIVLNTFILLYAILKTDDISILSFSVFIGLFLFTFLIMWIFGPIGKKEYRRLWIETRGKV
jgi:hypothetical protein